MKSFPQLLSWDDSNTFTLTMALMHAWMKKTKQNSYKNHLILLTSSCGR